MTTTNLRLLAKMFGNVGHNERQAICETAAAELESLQSRLDDSLRLNSQAANEIGELKQRLEKAEAMCVVKDDALRKGLTWDSQRNVIYYAQLNETFRSAISTTCGEELLRERNALREALQAAISTVECASIDIKTGEELPWHKMAVAAMSKGRQ